MVLVVDDDRLIVWALVRALGEDAQGATTIGEGLLLAEQWQPRVIFLDVRFQDRISGIDCVQMFKRAAPGAAIVVMSGFPDGVESRRALDLGATMVIAKSDLTPFYLRIIIETLLELQS
jgi:ActR/RegA family two-component response regulator